MTTRSLSHGRQEATLSVCVVSQVREQPVRLLLCPFIIAHLMELFQVRPQLDLAAEITIYSQQYKCYSIGVAPKTDLAVISSQGRNWGEEAWQKEEQERESKTEREE